MRKSARILGQDFGLNSQEMNYILNKEGYLEGEPGAYTVSEKGAPYAEEKDFHRGTGGYDHYNAYWSTITWDDSIVDELNISNDKIREARKVVAAARRQKRDEINAGSSKIENSHVIEQNQNAYDFDDSDESYDTNEPYNSTDKSSSELGTTLIIGGLLVLGYGVYKAAPHVIKWWKNTASPKLLGNRKFEVRANIVKQMLCPACGGTMKLDENTNLWECDKCDYKISGDAINNGEIFWFCDNCETFLNIQPGFNTSIGNWECNKCGFDNDLSDANMDDI